MPKLITIKIFNNLSDLSIAKAFVESEGIECVVKNELANQTSPYGAATTTGIELQTAECDVERAIELLIEGGFAQKEDYETPTGIKMVGNFLDWLKSLGKARK